MNRNTLRTASHVVILLLALCIISGCSIGVSPTTLPPTAVPTLTPTPSPTAPPTSCQGPYTWAYGSITPEFIDRVQEAMSTAGIKGTVQASTFGENNGDCGYGAMAVDYVFTIQVENLEASGDLASAGSTILEIAKRFVGPDSAPNLGHLRLIFQSNNQQCEWGYGDGAWNSAAISNSNTTVCPVPTSPESEKLKDMLTALSTDLACEKSAVTTNTLQATLECERPEAKNRYIVTVTLRLNGHGNEGACFHGYKAFESSSTGDTPMTVTDDSGSCFERDRSFQWTANGVLYDLFERIKGGQDVTYPADTREKVFQRAMQAGLITGEGSDCQ